MCHVKLLCQVNFFSKFSSEFCCFNDFSICLYIIFSFCKCAPITQGCTCWRQDTFLTPHVFFRLIMLCLLSCLESWGTIAWWNRSFLPPSSHWFWNNHLLILTITHWLEGMCGSPRIQQRSSILNLKRQNFEIWHFEEGKKNKFTYPSHFSPSFTAQFQERSLAHYLCKWKEEKAHGEY